MELEAVDKNREIEDLKIERDWWKKHAEAMESKLSLATRGFKVETTGMKDILNGQ